MSLRVDPPTSSPGFWVFDRFEALRRVIKEKPTDPTVALKKVFQSMVSPNVHLAHQV